MGLAFGEADAEFDAAHESPMQIGVLLDPQFGFFDHETLADIAGDAGKDQFLADSLNLQPVIREVHDFHMPLYHYRALEVELNQSGLILEITQGFHRGWLSGTIQ